MSKETQTERFRQAVDKKAAEAEEASKAQSAQDHAAQTDANRNEPGDVDPRTKNSRHGQVTADKWNQ